jgi:HAMP domain-containing protein
MRKLSVILLMIAMVAVISACSSPPQQLLDQATAAREEAKSSGGEIYAADTMAQAETAFAAAEAEIAAQGKKFAASRNYKVATEKLNEAMSAYNQAKMDATTAKESMKGEVETMAKMATTEVDEVEQMLAKAIAAKPKADMTAMQNMVAALRQGLTDAGAAQSAEDYVTAKAKLQSVIDGATQLKSQMGSTASR